MNAQKVATILVSAGTGILAGVAISWGEATRRSEMRSRAHYDNAIEAHKRALEMSEQLKERWLVEAPAEREEDLDGPDMSGDAVRVGGEMIVETSIADVTPSADYLAAARDYTTAVTPAVETIVEYITSEEYEEEDGRAKEQILIHMGPDGPLFINEGMVVPDWEQLISPNILVDMYQRIPPSEPDKVLYVRNHRNDTDYEVIQEIP